MQEVAEAERLFLDQKSKTHDLLLLHRRNKKSSIIEKCSGGLVRARKNFWSYVSPSNKQSTDISAVQNPDSGVLECNPDRIISQVEDHLTSVFKGSYEKATRSVNSSSDHTYPRLSNKKLRTCTPDHSYSLSPSPCLPKLDSSSSLKSDPDGWINRDYELVEVKNEEWESEGVGYNTKRSVEEPPR